MDFMIFDFETLSNITTEAPIISWGAIAGTWDKEYSVDELRESGFYRNVDAIHQCETYGLKANQETLKWWASQGEEAKRVLKATDKISIEKCIAEFNKWCSDVGVDTKTQVWIRAPHFDMTIYENLLRLTGKSIYRPFMHWNVRDTRTACDIIYANRRGYMPGNKEKFLELGLVEHNALDDCIKEYVQLYPWFGKSND